MLLPKIAEVAVEQASYHFDKLYSYVIPDAMEGVQPGCRVLVPFGGGNRKTQGIVTGVITAAQRPKLKPISALLDAEPLLNEEMLELAFWLKERTFCTLFEAVHTMLPSGLYMKLRPSYRLGFQAPSGEAQALLAPLERQLLQLIEKSGEDVSREKIIRALGLTSESTLPEEMVTKGWLVRTDAAARIVGDATVRMVRLAFDPDDFSDVVSEKTCTEKQRSVLRLLCDCGAASVKELCYFSSVTPAVVQALEKKRLVECYEHEVLRSANADKPLPPIRSAILNEEQQVAYKGLVKQYTSGTATAALLYGVTGSGKTSVYMNLIDRVLEDGRQVLVLVPEISLTPQMMQLFLSKYGRRVAVLHSALAIGERVDEWKRIKRGEASIVVGTRSAVFAPFSSLGLVVLDEEQEHTYKSESSPRYHTRDVARFRCARHNALLLLTSATPSVESYHMAQSGRYTLYTLRSRYGTAQLPHVEIADMREEPAADAIIGSYLESAIHTCLENHKQAVLLLNRRGYNTFVSCRSCGHVVTCPSCSISLTYHRTNRQLMCHYCGHTEPLRSHCPECGSDKIRYSGLGTQRVEEELSARFPEARILRMDADTTMSRFAYERKFEAFGKGEYDILIGTQMVAKGLDFPHVSLVGILSADQSLFGADYKCFETTFSLLTQVIGRAGRRDERGRAIIQTYSPEHYIIGFAAQQDYDGFFNTEIRARRLMKYPPFADLCMFGFVGKEENEVKEAAYAFLKQLHVLATGQYAGVPIIALDPTPAVVARVAGKYRYKLLIKTVNSTRLRQMLKELLADFNRRAERNGLRVFVDINPAGLL
ncbi:MAG: primosomal protein N' [Clostridia bacterium]|nr:primosomal protein N' [Clostridia bacterium]